MQSSRNNLLQACRTLFGREIVLTPGFLAYLQPNGAKMAYRSQVKTHHPDRFTEAPKHIREQQTERFREIHQAYLLLKEFLENRLKTSPTVSKATPRTAQKSPRRRQNPSYSEDQAAIPAIPLEYGMFAYYSGKISYRDLLQALAWQRRQRPTIGRIARQWGWLDEQQIRTILEQRRPSQRFGKKAVELQHLRPRQVEILLTHQRSQQQKLGQYFVKQGQLTQAEANHLAGELRKHNTRLRDRTG